MTANGRPNLGGLFTGATPPDRSSSIADALDPRGATGRPAPDRSGSPGRPRQTVGGDEPQGTAPTPADPTPTDPQPAERGNPRAETPAPPAADQHVPGQLVAIQWLDPMRALGYYFDFLQGLLDAQRRVTMSVAAAVTAPVRRAGLWR